MPDFDNPDDPDSPDMGDVSLGDSTPFTLSAVVYYAPNPATAAFEVVQAGQTFGPFSATVTANPDGISWTLAASITGPVAGSVSVQPGDIIGGVFVPNGPAITGVLSNDPPPLPAYLFPVATWRTRLRSLIGDEPLPVAAGQTVDPSALVVLPDTALDEALREALAALSEWRPRTGVLPILSVIPGQSAYQLPADFAEPIDETWGSLLAPDPFESGQFPGSRDFFRQRQSLRDSAMPYGQAGQYGATFGLYTGLWAGGFYGGGMPVLPEDANGDVIAGGFGLRPRVDFYPASYASPSPVMVLTPAPSYGQTIMGAKYRAIALPQRLTVDDTGAAWTVDGNGSLVFTPAYLSQDFVDATDVLPFAASDQQSIRLLLRYAASWAIMQKVIPLSETDSEKFAFYEIRTGLGRKDLLAIADKCMKEFDAGTKKVPHGVRY